jgi:hypothetical protein
MMCSAGVACCINLMKRSASTERHVVAKFWFFCFFWQRRSLRAEGGATTPSRNPHGTRYIRCRRLQRRCFFTLRLLVLDVAVLVQQPA